MARSQKAETRLWVWRGSLVHDVLPLTKDLHHRRQRPIGRFATIATALNGTDQGPHTSHNFSSEAVVRRLVSHRRDADLFRFSDTRTVRQGRKKMVEEIVLDIYVAKDHSKAWVVPKS